jgi:hypothetical protein
MRERHELSLTGPAWRLDVLIIDLTRRDRFCSGLKLGRIMGEGQEQWKLLICEEPQFTQSRD